METRAKSYESVLARYPDEVATAINKLRRGKSVCRERPPEDFSWTFVWGVIGRAYSLGDIASGRVHINDPLPPVRERITLGLCMARRHFWTQVEIDLKAHPIPEEVEEVLALWDKENIVPPVAVADALKQLKQLPQNPGFVIVTAVQKP